MPGSPRACALLKEWVRLEGSREFHFESQDLIGPVYVLIPAGIAPNRERAVDSRWRRESISLSKRDFVPRIDVHVAMNLHIPANDNPSVGRMLPVIPCDHATPSNIVVRETVAGILAQLR